MLAGRSFSIAELEEQTGFDRRTIVYYIQQGLIARPGRRGPNTRYPEDAQLRLRFVRGVKDHQDQGRCGTVTLADIRRMLGVLDSAALRDLVDRGVPATELGALLERSAPAPPPPPPPRPTVSDRRSYGLADAGIRNRLTVGPTAPATTTPHEDTEPRLPALVAGSPPAPGIDPAIEDNLGELLRQLEVRPGLAGRRLAPGASEHWTEIPITSRVFLSVRGLSETDAPLADAVARALKKVLRTR
jgi:DNA-binding transcriptional MerR regulator